VVPAVAHDVQPAAVGQADVADQQIEPLAVQHRKSRPDARRRPHVEAG
jgi:hypothetical protein